MKGLGKIGAIGLSALTMLTTPTYLDRSAMATNSPGQGARRLLKPGEDELNAQNLQLLESVQRSQQIEGGGDDRLRGIEQSARDAVQTLLWNTEEDDDGTMPS